MTVLVTGGTGTLGRPTVALLRQAGHDIRVLSRRSGAGTHVGDLSDGSGLAPALEDVRTVVHLATSARGDDRSTGLLIAAAHQAGVQHLLYVSIVGIDYIPLPYYRRKLQAERLISAAPLPFTLLRCTQFHPLVARLFAAQPRLPWLLVPDLTLQPIDVVEVADRVAALLSAGPSGRVADIGGPEVRPVRQFAEQWLHHRDRRCRPVAVPLPGRTFAAYRAGPQLVPGPPAATRTFADFLERDPV